MYRRPKFLEILLEIRQEMALEADYDVDLFAETARSGKRSPAVKGRGFITHDMSAAHETDNVPQLKAKTPSTLNKVVQK